MDRRDLLMKEQRGETLDTFLLRQNIRIRDETVETKNYNK